MKWIGQYIQNLKATFRQNVTLDSTLTFDSVALTGVQTSAESFVDDDVSIMTSAAIDDRINTAVTAEDLDVAADSGTAAVDLNSQSLTVTGGTNITTSATGQAVTVNLADASTSTKGAASFATADFAVSAGAVSLKERTCFEFKGYGTSGQDGEGNAAYDMQQEMTDNQAPFQHDTSTGSDGLTAQTTNTVMRSGGKVMPYGGKLTKFQGWVTSQGSDTIHVALFKFTPIDNNASNLEAVLLIDKTVTAAGNTKMRRFSETSFSVTFAAEDIIYSAVKGETDAKIWYFSSVLEVEWD